MQVYTGYMQRGFVPLEERPDDAEDADEALEEALHYKKECVLMKRVSVKMRPAR